MSVFVTYNVLPSFPPTDQFGVGAVRTQIGGFWVDYLGTTPTLAEVQAQAAPTAAQVTASNRAQIKASLDNPDQTQKLLVALLTVLWNKIPALKTVWPTLAAMKTDIKTQVDSM